MNSLRIYKIADDYIRFLRECDDRVQDNKGRRRPYVGIVLSVGERRYFVPMESPKPNHTRIRPGIHVLHIDNGKLGLLGFNNMIPVPDHALIDFNIDDEPDAHYAGLLRRQTSWINRNTGSILSHASMTYDAVLHGNNQFLLKVCCDFRRCERRMDEYCRLYGLTQPKPKARDDRER